MQKRPFGRLGEVSALTLGGGGIGQLWGKTTRDECVATVREAIKAGITLLDVAPLYGNGEAERVVGEAFDGKLPGSVRISTKCRLENPPADQVYSVLEKSLHESLERMQLSRVDLFLLHSQIIPDTSVGKYAGTPLSLFREAAVPAFERLRAQGIIGAWGITGIGVPEAVIDVLNDDPAPYAAQCITNLLDSPGNLKRYDEAARPRDIIAVANRRGVGVMGIRAVQAGALSDAFDRVMGPERAADVADYDRAAPFRALAKDLRESTAQLAHRYALSMSGVSTVVLGVKNRQELWDCVAAEAKGSLVPNLIARIDRAVGRLHPASADGV